MQKKAPETTKPVPAEFDFAQYRIANPEEFSRNMLKLMEEGGRVLSGLLERSNGNGPYSFSSEITEATKLFSEVAQHWLADPGKAGATQSALMRDYLQLAGATAQRMAGTGAPPVVTPEPGDNRFNDP
jgi:poly[(R)-3-hydroxyalkanoate] polymerase subunit PhaC